MVFLLSTATATNNENGGLQQVLKKTEEKVQSSKQHLEEIKNSNYFVIYCNFKAESTLTLTYVTWFPRVTYLVYTQTDLKFTQDTGKTKISICFLFSRLPCYSNSHLMICDKVFMIYFTGFKICRKLLVRNLMTAQVRKDFKVPKRLDKPQNAQSPEKHTQPKSWLCL